MTIIEPFFCPPLAEAEKVKGRRMRVKANPRRMSPTPVQVDSESKEVGKKGFMTRARERRTQVSNRLKGRRSQPAELDTAPGKRCNKAFRSTVDVHENVPDTLGPVHRLLLLGDLVESVGGTSERDGAELDRLLIRPEQDDEGRSHGDGEDDTDCDGER